VLGRRLRDRIAVSVAQLAGIDWQRCVLGLSGGYDSRAILLFLRQSSSVVPATITWGTSANRNAEGSDARIAAELAGILGATNEFIRNDAGPDPIEVALGRFLRCGEGRTGSLTGYLDGCETWRRLRESGVEVFVRGDEAFGWNECSGERGVRQSMNASLATDFAELPQWCRLAALPQQEMPAPLKRRRRERLADWRDRMYQTFRGPTYLTGL
jgi:predicted PP-loop superfamily ATPase